MLTQVRYVCSSQARHSYTIDEVFFNKQCVHGNGVDTTYVLSLPCADSKSVCASVRPVPQKRPTLTWSSSMRLCRVHVRTCKYKYLWLSVPNVGRPVPMVYYYTIANGYLSHDEVYKTKTCNDKVYTTKNFREPDYLPAAPWSLSVPLPLLTSSRVPALLRSLSSGRGAPTWRSSSSFSGLGVAGGKGEAMAVAHGALCHGSNQVPMGGANPNGGPLGGEPPTGTCSPCPGTMWPVAIMWPCQCTGGVGMPVSNTGGPMGLGV